MYKGKVFSKGSECPPPQEGTMRVYGNRFCPYVKRLLLVLQYLEVPHEVININLKSKPDWFLEKTPVGSVPVMEVGGGVIYESLICSRYVDQVYGEGRLLGKDAFKEAQQCMWLAALDKMNRLFFEAMRDPESLEEKKAEAEGSLRWIEAVCSGGYFGGTEPNFFDLMTYPFFQRFHISKDVCGDEFFDANKFPKLSGWMGVMEEQVFAQKCFESHAIHASFVKQYFDPACVMPDFDIGL